MPKYLLSCILYAFMLMFSHAVVAQNTTTSFWPFNLFNKVTPEKQTEPLFSPDSICEKVVMYCGQRTIRIQADQSISQPEKMKNQENCFLVLSKKDYYIYVYEAQENDTVMLARYDCAFALKKGDKTKQGDMRTPHCVNMDTPFTISEIKNSAAWYHDFGDGRGNILSYGPYFIRLQLNGHLVERNRSIGIHGSTNNEQTVPGRASEGCIRLKDADIKNLRENYAFVGMKVYIKSEEADDLDFEKSAIKTQQVSRLRHLNPEKLLSNEQIAEYEVSNAQ